ncbi:MAG: helix-turn-helix transcriptional regulator [Epsilonproteobacteria bacterium]|nr:MAG: helix-turn-helix transcriptional regulator [Campylobacterota bacterium]
MLEVNEIIEKLRDVLSSEKKIGKVFDKEIASALEISTVNFATIKKRNSIPFSNILDFCALKKISINWLLYGQDPSSLVDSTDRYWIKYFPTISVSAGGGAYDSEDEYEKLDIPDFFVNIVGGKDNVKNIEAINVTGDSMEPTLNNGNIIFIDKTKQDSSKDGIYAFVNENGLFVKRIQKRIDGGLDIISDNKEYPIQIAQKNEINILGKVVSSIGKVF